MWWVYILKSSVKQWYYVGSTNRLDERVAEHNARKVKSTKGYAPLKLVYKTELSDEKAARDFEKRLKDKRIEKEALIRHIEGVR